MRLGVALGSGGARGLAHVGVLSVLEQEGLRPFCIAGTSMGAIVGALYADVLDAELVAERIGGYTGDPQFQATWEPFLDEETADSDRGFFQGLRRSIHRKILTFKTFTSPSLQTADPLLDPLQRLFKTDVIEDLKLPFAAVALDLLSGAPRIFRSGSLVQAIYASSAIPGIFPPLPLDGQLLIDGGGAYRVPVGICRQLGADLVLALDIPTFAPEKAEYRRGLDIMMRMDEIALNRLNKFVLKEADFVVRPEVARFHWARFGAYDSIRQAGEEAMRQALPDLRRLIRDRSGIRHRLQEAARRLVGWRP
jgi:NTE family protein